MLIYHLRLIYKISKNKKKLFVYVDESGQDTKGEFFIVSVVIIEEYRDSIVEKLEHIELKINKHKKWTKTKSILRKEYITIIKNSDFLKYSIFFDICYNSKEYLKIISKTTCSAILEKM